MIFHIRVTSSAAFSQNTTLSNLTEYAVHMTMAELTS